MLRSTPPLLMSDPIFSTLPDAAAEIKSVDPFLCADIPGNGRKSEIFFFFMNSHGSTSQLK